MKDNDANFLGSIDYLKWLPINCFKDKCHAGSRICLIELIRKQNKPEIGRLTALISDIIQFLSKAGGKKNNEESPRNEVLFRYRPGIKYFVHHIRPGLCC